MKHSRLRTCLLSYGARLVYPAAANAYQMFKVVLSRVFDLRCNLDEISGAGEPLLLFSKEDGGGTASKAKGASSSSAGAGPGSTSSEGATKDALKGARNTAK